MSYNKHHSPTQQVIYENIEQNDQLMVVRPCKGIDSNKHQPIIRQNKDSKIRVDSILRSNTPFTQRYKNFIRQTQ